MDTTVIIEASIKMGLPLAIISWFLFSWLHKQGDFDLSGDRKNVEANLKERHKSRRSQRKHTTQTQQLSWLARLRKRYTEYTKGESASASQGGTAKVFDRWMWFGSGFYGMAALWTFFVVEVSEVVNFIYNFPGFAELFSNGVVALVVEFVVNQITNLFGAFAWMVYWDRDNVPIWMLIAYLGYMAGMKLAQLRR